MVEVTKKVVKKGNARWPIVSEAAGGHPSQAGELREFFSRSGIPTEVTSEGNPIFTGPKHRRRCLKALGMHDRSGFD